MKALSVRQPWAYLICSGIKDIENRSWRTNYRGRILIHASAKWDDRARSMNQLFTPGQWGVGIQNDFLRNTLVIQPLKVFPVSAIIGSVEIVDCIKDSRSIWAEDHVYHWVLSDPVLFREPILDVKGSLSLWEYTGEVPG